MYYFISEGLIRINLVANRYEELVPLHWEVKTNKAITSQQQVSVSSA